MYDEHTHLSPKEIPENTRIPSTLHPSVLQTSLADSKGVERRPEAMSDSYPLLYMWCKTLPETSCSKSSFKQTSDQLSSCYRVLQDSNSLFASSIWCDQRKLNNTCKDTRVTAQTVTLSLYMSAVRIFKKRYNYTQTQNKYHLQL